MRAALAIGLLVAVTGLANPAQATDWEQTCAQVGHFAGLLAVERDQRAPLGRAIKVARRLLDHPPMITEEVGDEIAHQVYASQALSPAQEDATLRAKCLTPVGQPSSESRTPSARVEVLAPIELDVGSNQVARFAPDGRDATVILAWQDDGSGHGRDVFSASVTGSGSVIMPGGGDSIRDDPGNDRDMRSSVRFARGQVNGAVATLLLRATRTPGEGATQAVYQVFRLIQEDNHYRFAPVLTERLAPFCNADMALSTASGLPLRRSYRGPMTANGCPSQSELARQE
jgi:hypothetical protein